MGPTVVRVVFAVAAVVFGVSAMSQLPSSPQPEPPRDASAKPVDTPFERPYSAAFHRLGDKVFIVLKSQSGQVVAVSEPLQYFPVAAAVPKDDWILGRGTVVSWSDIAFHASGCADVDVEVTDETHVTDTHIITIVVTKTYCDGELIDVDVNVIRVKLPTPEAPDEQ